MHASVYMNDGIITKLRNNPIMHLQYELRYVKHTFWKENILINTTIDVMHGQLEKQK